MARHAVPHRMAEMASAISQERFVTPAEYLALERAAEYKSEYFAGEMFAMAGGTPRHSLISANMIREIGNLLNGRDCRVYDSNLRVKVIASGLYTYPDVSVVCGRAEFDDVERDTLLNPFLLVEVLSPATESYDRGRKFNFYREIASLSTYLLVSQDTPRVEQLLRQENGHWLWSDASGVEAQLHLPSLGVDLRLREVFAHVEFEPISLRAKTER